ncbi:MAG: hypothetical protein ACLFQ8_01605 [Candidatus Aenigmatarchaeota archaeon]
MKSIDGKGQVITIIGVAMVLILYLISTAGSYSFLVEEAESSRGLQNRKLEDLRRSFEESYREAASNGTSYRNINKELSEFTNFSSLKSRPSKVQYLFSTSLHHNSSEVKVGVHNFLGRSIRNVYVNETLCSDLLEDGENCSVELVDESGEYVTEFYYNDSLDGSGRTKTYRGITHGNGNHSSVFYRIELKDDLGKMMTEERSWSRQIS